MKLILISGDGIGAGKTTLAKKLAPVTISLSNGIRIELNNEYPTLPWDSRSQEEKDQPRIELSGLTIRDLLIEKGQSRCYLEPEYWARRAGDRIQETFIEGSRIVSVDDIRKLMEIGYLRERFHQWNVTHFHVSFSGATHEPQFENQQLHDVADYVIVRKQDV